MLGLSSQQLLESKTYPLSDDDWQSMAMMPAGYFIRRWKLVEEKGNAAQMMKIAAILARVIDVKAENLTSIVSKVDAIAPTPVGESPAV